ncbi:MAG: hypothetical protein EOO77_16000, partial [Oxalobacteraceae bacterium]
MVTDIANETFFPGNGRALERLTDELRGGHLTAFVGSGVSIPLAPSWNGLLSQLIDQGLTDGFVNREDEPLLRQQVHDDPLELASTLEEAFTPAKFRSIVGGKFRLEGKCTEGHELIVQLTLNGIITLNYDDGLSTAYVRHRQMMPSIIRADDRFELQRWATDHSDAGGRCPIIHWHGNTGAPDRMVLTADDYDRHYATGENRAFIEELWRGQRLFVIGFGFRDPILTRLAESVIRSSPADNQHIALVGRHDPNPMTPLLRRQFAKKFRVDPVFYQVTVDESGREDHSAMTRLLTAVLSQPATPKPATDRSDARVVTVESPSAAAEKELKDGLFVGPNGQTLYVEPKLVGRIVDTKTEEPIEIVYSVKEFVAQFQNTIITAPIEAGSTTLARRLVLEFMTGGSVAVLREAG